MLKTAEIIFLTQINAVMAQDRIGNRCVKKNIRQDKIQKIDLSRKTHFLAADLQCHLAILGAVDLACLKSIFNKAIAWGKFRERILFER